MQGRHYPPPRLLEFCPIQIKASAGKLVNERAIRFYEGFGFRFDGASQALDLSGEVTDLRMVLQRN